MRVLLVDDEAPFADMLRQRLELRGVDAVVAHDARQALDLLESRPPGFVDMVFLDVNLPGMDGVTLLRHLRESYPDMDVVMLSGATEMRTAVRAMRRGAANWLPKPVEVDALLDECRRSAERRRQRQREARLAEGAMLRSLGRVAEGVAHEVNNPVNIMMNAAGWVGDLLDDLEQVEAVRGLPQLGEMRDALARIREQSLRVREITRRLLVFGKGMDASVAPVDVPEVLAKAAAMLAGRAAAAGVEVRMDAPPDLPRPHGSAVELHQICVHVMENALDAMPQGGRLDVRAHAERPEDGEGAYVLAFADTGPGMAPDVLPHVFDPFFTTRAKGAGLGLAVSQSLARRCGGRIEAANAAQGSVFTVYLPLNAAG